MAFSALSIPNIGIQLDYVNTIDRLMLYKKLIGDRLFPQES